MKPHVMDRFNEQNILIKFNLFKQLQFYQIFHSNGIKIFGWNIHQLFYIFYALVGLCIGSYGIFTSFSTNCKFLSNIDYFLIFYITTQNYLSYWKLFKCLKDRNRFLDLFKIGQLNFLTSEECTKYSKVLYKHRDKNSKFVNYYLIFSFVVILQWFIFPIVINQIIHFENSNIRAENIINFCFGVSTSTYNKYYLIFYLLETTVSSLTVYILIMMDILIISLCSAIIYQQEILIYAFKNIGYEDNLTINYYNKLISILQDQLRLNVKIKLFYSLMKSTILLTVAIDSLYLIFLMYFFILICLTPGSDTLLPLIKISISVVYITGRLFIYCYLFDNINIKRESVNFNIYSCNWTKMNLKFKKLLLLTMQMNDANRMGIKASPKKIINLQLFAGIISMSFNMVPVLLKITNSENQKPQQT